MESLKKLAKKLPHRPGVYLFKDSRGAILYVGKARDLAKRVADYFGKTSDVKTNELVHRAQTLDFLETVSEFDALILEARLIGGHQPKYNVIAKDDKSPLYVILTLTEELPRIIFARKKQLPLLTKRKKDMVFGPFQSAKMIRSIMRELRHVIPYCLQKRRNGTPCFYTHLGLCDPCPCVISPLPDSALRRARVTQYRLSLRRLAAILSGHGRTVLDQMMSQMNQLSRKQKFEGAGRVRNYMQALYRLLERHYDPAVYMSAQGGVWDVYEKERDELRVALSQHIPNIGNLKRIECIDVSNISGNQATGSLVVLIDGRPDTSMYRRFRVRYAGGANDVAMIGEVLARRLTHREWPLPSLFLIDGGKGQVAAAVQTLAHAGITVPVVGLAKRREEIIVPKGDRFVTLRLPLTSASLHLLERARDEAHRFALSYHRLLRKKRLTLASSFVTIDRT